ncbi:MAG: Sua5/YciO/YrdC/YwlC family protein, partial [Thermoflexus sp.]
MTKKRQDLQRPPGAARGEPDALPPGEVARLTADYLKALENKYAHLRGDETRPPLESVFFMLQARERPERRPLEPPPGDLPLDPARRVAADAPLPSPFGEVAGGEAPPVPLGEALSKEPRLVILGEPGAGKTTALQFVTLCFARRAEGWHQERLGIEQPYIPILLTLQTHAAAIAERHLFDVLADEVRSYLPGCSEAQAAALLRAGGIVAFPTETVFGLGADARNEVA